MNGWRVLWPLVGGLLLLLAGCAELPVRDANPMGGFWQGRLALRVDSDPPQSFFAGFELSGGPTQGELLLTGPFAQTLGQLTWSPGQAVWRAQGGSQRFDSLSALTMQTTGTAIPVERFFDWLAGRSLEVEPAGWQVDLSSLAQGRLLARRLQPAPSTELRLIIESR